MRIHHTDPSYIAARAHSIRDWREIGALCSERAIHRLGILEERRDWRNVQRTVGMEE